MYKNTAIQKTPSNWKQIIPNLLLFLAPFLLHGQTRQEPLEEPLEGVWKGTIYRDRCGFKCQLTVKKINDSIYDFKANRLELLNAHKNSYLNCERMSISPVEFQGIYWPKQRVLLLVNEGKSRLGKERCYTKLHLYYSYLDTIPSLESVLIGQFQLFTCGSQISLDVKKDYTDEQLAARIEKYRIQDSTRKAGIANLQIEYLTCDNAYTKWALQTLRTSIYSCNELNVFVSNVKDTNVIFNQAFSYSTADRTYSDEFSLASEINNLYDTRMFGTWHTKNYSMICQLTKSCISDHLPFEFVTYYYSEREKMYLGSALQPRIRMWLEGELTVTNIDSVLLYETVFQRYQDNIGSKYLPDMRKITFHIPAKYELVDDNHLVVSAISANYARASFGSKSGLEYRDFVRRNMNRKDFFINPLSLIRYTGSENLDHGVDDEIITALKKLEASLLKNPNWQVCPDYLSTSQEVYKSIQAYNTRFDNFWNPVR